MPSSIRDLVSSLPMDDITLSITLSTVDSEDASTKQAYALAMCSLASIKACGSLKSTFIASSTDAANSSADSAASPNWSRLNASSTDSICSWTVSIALFAASCAWSMALLASSQPANAIAKTIVEIVFFIFVLLTSESLIITIRD